MVSNTCSMPAKALQPKHNSTCHSKEAQMNSRTLIPRAPHSLLHLAATVGSSWCFLPDYYRCGAHTHADKEVAALCLGLAKDLVRKLTRSNSRGTCSSLPTIEFQNENWLIFLRMTPHLHALLTGFFCHDEVLRGNFRHCFCSHFFKSSGFSALLFS